MATKSILKNINIKNKRSSRAFVSALENAKGKHAREVHFTKMCSEPSREQIRLMFGAENDRISDR